MVQPLGESAFWILATLASGPQHGYGVMQAVRTASGDRVQLKATTLYAVLERLEGEALIEQAGDEVVDGRTRRYYVLTDAGAGRLRHDTELLESKVTAARTSLGRFRPVEKMA